MQNTLSDIKLVKKIRQLLITLPQISGCPNEVEKTYYISFVLKDEKFLKKHEPIWIGSGTLKKNILIDNQFILMLN